MQSRKGQNEEHPRTPPPTPCSRLLPLSFVPPSASGKTAALLTQTTISTLFFDPAPPPRRWVLIEVQSLFRFLYIISIYLFLLLYLFSLLLLCFLSFLPLSFSRLFSCFLVLRFSLEITRDNSLRIGDTKGN